MNVIHSSPSKPGYSWRLACQFFFCPVTNSFYLEPPPAQRLSNLLCKDTHRQSEKHKCHTPRYKLITMSKACLKIAESVRFCSQIVAKRVSELFNVPPIRPIVGYTSSPVWSVVRERRWYWLKCRQEFMLYKCPIFRKFSRHSPLNRPDLEYAPICSDGRGKAHIASQLVEFYLEICSEKRVKRGTHVVWVHISGSALHVCFLGSSTKVFWEFHSERSAAHQIIYPEILSGSEHWKIVQKAKWENESDSSIFSLMVCARGPLIPVKPFLCPVREKLCL